MDRGASSSLRKLDLPEVTTKVIPGCTHTSNKIHCPAPKRLQFAKGQDQGSELIIKSQSYNHVTFSCSRDLVEYSEKYSLIRAKLIRSGTII